MTQEDQERLERENTVLRAMCAKLMPCHYCGVDDIGLCPHGFPGCALADDLLEFGELTNKQVRALLEQNALLKEQIRVGDKAFQHQFNRVNQLESELIELRRIIKNESKGTGPQGYRGG